MMAVKATDVLRKDIMAVSFDDNTINYSTSSTDWKTKYIEVADMLAETRAELDDFHFSSKELEEELERELERTEKAQQDLKVKVARAEQERDEWKSKFMSLQTNHNTTTTSLQRELDTLRQEYQKIKIQLRELEMGNDDLERNERAISSSLADIEGKYSRVLEEKILLEHELLDKANTEEEAQRLKDELRDANEDIVVLKEKLAAAQARVSNPSNDGTSSSVPSSLLPNIPTAPSDEDLLKTTALDLQLSDLTSPPTTPVKDYPSTPRSKLSTSTSMLHRPNFYSSRTALSTPPGATPSSLSRSSTVPSSSFSPSRFTPTRVPPRATSSKTLPIRPASFSTSSGIPSTVTKSRGVQMVSDMRARVKVLEQKIQTRVPRIRMGSITSRPNASVMPSPRVSSSSARTSSPAASSSSSMRSIPRDERGSMRSRPQSLGNELDTRRTPASDSSGWVLIMEDSPSPIKDKEKEKRRVSITSAPSAFRPTVSTSASNPPTVTSRPLNNSTLAPNVRRPQSRLSISTEGRSSVSTMATTSTASSILTPSSRPSTPTFLPVPSAGLYADSAGLKRSTGPRGGAYSQMKRSPYGNGRSPVVHLPPSRLPSPSPPPHTNAALRPLTKVTTQMTLTQSRIGRPGNGGLSGRKSGGDTSPEHRPDVPSKNLSGIRSRAGSHVISYNRNV